MTPLAMSLLGVWSDTKAFLGEPVCFYFRVRVKLSCSQFKIQQLVTTQQRRCEYLLHMYTRESLGLGLLSVFVKSPHL